MEDRHFDRLTNLVKWSYLEMQANRQLHFSIVEHMKGEHYPRSVRQGGPATSMNLLSMASRGMSRHTISKAPRVLVNAAGPGIKTWAENAEQSVNKRIERSNLSAELAECARQSMVSVGVFFMGPMYVGTENSMKLDLVFKAISFPDYVHDMSSLTLEESDLQGHKARIPIADIRDNPLFDEEARLQVDTSAGRRAKPDEDDANSERSGGVHGDLYDYADIWCIYERRRNKLIYFPVNQPDLKLLEMDWMGPRHGPYRYLYYERPPNSAFPIAPMMHLLKKHRSFNLLDVKAIHQQQVSKGILYYTNASKEEAKTIINAVDNQSVLRESGATRWAHVGGASPDTVAMADKQRADFSYVAGNLDSYMGLSPSADTLGQERLMAGAANAMLEDMAEYAKEFVKGVCEDIFWFDIRDPSEDDVRLVKTIPGTELSYETYWTKAHRDFALEMEFEVDVEPYSYVSRSPQERLADLLGSLQILMGMGDQMVAQGISIDIEAVVRVIAKYKNIPELYDVLILNQEPGELQSLLGPKQEGGSSSTDNSPRRYIRESRSDGTAENVEIMRMMGRSQDQEVKVA